MKVKTVKIVRFEPYDKNEIIVVPEDRHNLTYKQKKEAIKYFKNSMYCHICGDKSDIKSLHIDHCHITGVIRGMLCYHCNIGLGMFKDNLYNIKKASEYLERFKYNPDMVDQDLWSKKTET